MEGALIPLDTVSALLVAVVAFRALPFCVYVVLSAGYGWRIKQAAVLCYAAVAVGCYHLSPGALLMPKGAAAGLAYYGAVAVALHALLRFVPELSGRVGKLAVFSGCLVANLMLPALLFHDLAAATFLVLGFGLTLSSYSYCTERQARACTLGDTLFFLLVDPTLVFPQRARRGPSSASPWPGMLRAAAGIGALFAVAALVQPATAWLDPRLSGYIAFLFEGSLAFLVVYGQHSGVASLEIGLMRALGYQLPERYNHPYRAAGPLDFWRRWNTYVGSWLRRYVFIPAARAAGRRGAALGHVGMAGALVATFVAIGLLHDLYDYVARTELSLRWTAGFTFIGLAALCWLGAARLAQRLRRGGFPHQRAATLATSLASRVAFAHSALAVTWYWF